MERKDFYKLRLISFTVGDHVRTIEQKEMEELTKRKRKHIKKEFLMTWNSWRNPIT